MVTATVLLLVAGLIFARERKLYRSRKARAGHRVPEGHRDETRARVALRLRTGEVDPSPMSCPIVWLASDEDAA